MTSDTELVERSRRHDADAFGALVSRHQRLVFGVALAHCHDPALAEDVAQEAFVTAWRDLDRLRDADRVGSWLAGIARNLAAGAARTRARRERAPIEPGPDVPTPEDQALEREDRELLARALSTIPDAHREALVLFYLEGQSIAEIARQLALREDAVKQRLSRGRAALRDSVADRVEAALSRTRINPAFKAGVVAALATAGTRKAGAGKVMLMMTSKKLAMLVAAVLAAAGAAVWIGVRGGGGGGGGDKPVAQAAPHAGSSVVTPHVTRLPDKQARDRLLAAIQHAQAQRAAQAPATGGGGGTTGARPTLPADEDLDKDYIRAAVRELIPLLTDCYEQGLARDPTIAGSVVANFTIQGEPDVGGLVTESQIDADRSTLADPAVRECIQQTMYSLQIDPPANGGVVHVSYPFTFAPAGPPPAEERR